MRRIYNAVVGILLIIAAVMGLVMSVGGIIGLGSVYTRIESNVKQQLTLLDQALVTTNEGLKTASDSVVQTQATLTSIQGTLDGSGKALNDIVPAVDAVGGVIGTKIPSALEGATKALTGFADTAAMIDKVMGVVSSIPFISIPAYNPQVPLAKSITDVRDSIGGFGGNLQDIETSLGKTSSNLKEIQGEVAGVSTAMAGLGTSLDGAVKVLASYQEIMGNLREQVDAATQGVSEALRWAQIVVTIALIWLGIASLGLLTLGWDLFQRSREQKRHEDAQVEPAPVEPAPAA
jgi:hypothetical protein